MSHKLFEGKQHSAIYQLYRFVPPGEIKELILHYLDEKKGRPHVLAVDVGCGTGQNCRMLSEHFQQVVGMDVSETQVAEAQAVPGFPNVSYRVAPAEELPFPHASLDLLTASSAAHYFDQEKFLQEACRVLKPRGCLALLGYTDSFELHYGSCGEEITRIYEEARDNMTPYMSPHVFIARSKLQALFDGIPFPDKERLDSIPETLQISVSGLLGFIESFSYYQTFKRQDPEAAAALLHNTQARLLQAMCVSSPDTEMEMRRNYYCVLACKPH